MRQAALKGDRKQGCEAEQNHCKCNISDHIYMVIVRREALYESERGKLCQAEYRNVKNACCIVQLKEVNVALQILTKATFLLKPGFVEITHDCDIIAKSVPSLF